MIQRKQPGEPTYRRFVVQSVFCENDRHILYSLWDREIISHLAGDWEIKIFEYSSIFGDMHIEVYRTIWKKRISVGVHISLHRDGFHIRISGPYSFTVSELLFGEKNVHIVWTRETKKVPTIANQIIREIQKILQKHPLGES